MSNRIQRRRQYVRHNRGAALLVLVVLFTAGSMLITASMGRAVYSDTVAYTRLQDTKQNILTADSSVEDIVYRLRTQKSVSDVEELALFSATTTTTMLIAGETTELATTATTTNRVRKRKMVLVEGGTGVAFNYGVQVGEGGIEMTNAASVDGNVYSNGPLVGANSMVVYGDAVSAGPAGLIDDVEVTGTAHAHAIEDSEIGVDAHYQVIDADTTVGGVKYPGSADQPILAFPISDETIEGFKQNAEDGGVVSCASYTISSQEVTLGPVKIDCDLTISGTSVVTLAGNVWVAGSITSSNTSKIQRAASLGTRSGLMIADKEVDRLTSSRISLNNSVQFIGNPDNGAYIVLLSQNNSAENGGSTSAISIANSVSGDLVLYASHGEINLSNSVHLTEVTSYKIRASNSAQVVYDEGLASILFSSGPSGGYRIESWDDIQ